MSKTLLLADDSVTIQKVVGISFASEDVTLLTVDNGEDAITKARDAKPDLVLADVVMPGKSGYEVCAALKADPELQHIPVILLTGTFEAFDEERAQEVGAASHVAKPFEAQTLVDEVKRVLATPKPAPESRPQTPPPPPPTPEATPEPAATAPDLADSSPGSPDDSFDFFDEDLGELAETNGESWGDGMAPGALDLDRDAAFAFGEDSLDPEPLSPPAEAGAAAAADREPAAELPPRRPDAGETQGEHTVAIMPEPELSIGEADLQTLEPQAAAPTPDAVSDDTPPSGFEFAFEEEQPGLVDPGDLAQDATVDPQGASGYDISSSDLQVSTDSPDAPPPTVLAEAEPLGDTEPRPLDSLPEIEPIAEAEPLSEAEPIAVAEPLAEAEPLEEIEPLPMASAPGPGASDEVNAVLDSIAPQLREQLHASLEKIASESFQDVTERIVRQAVERVERIAWEVIPHMAETLVREEIRRMKGEK